MEILKFLKRYSYVLLGHGCVALGFVGAFVPGLPTVPFLLIALWAYARSCPHFHTWLLNHQRFGPMLRDWQNHGVIPIRAKILAIASMVFSFAMCLWHAHNWYLPAVLAGILACSATFILTRPSQPQNVVKIDIPSES